MKILISGSHGLIGSAVAPYLAQCGHQISRLVRSRPEPGDVWWDPDRGEIDASNLEGFDGIVHLATMSWPMRWTAKAKESLRANRLGTNRLLAESLARCAHKPRVLVCASGMGYYASSGEEVLREDCPGGTSFLARLQQDGEAATVPASKAGIRVVHLRIPPVIGGPALLRASFQAGNGQQWMSWIGRDELACIIEFALTTESLSGPVNAVSPNPVRNAEFAVISSKVLGQKPAFVMPAFLAHLVMGEMGEEFLLASRRIQPAKLLAAGYQFRFPELADTMRHERDCLHAGSVSHVVHT